MTVGAPARRARGILPLVVGAILLSGGCTGSDDSAATDPPATQAPVTDPPPTDPPPTDPPPTDPPPTDPPPTDPPPTDPPPTDAPPTDPPPTDAPPTDPPPTDPPPTDPPPTDPPPTTEPAPPIVIGEPGDDGSIAVTIDGTALEPLFDEFTAGTDPFYLVHTQQEDVFVGVELYTVFGAQWTGQTGTFPSDCTTHGICVYLDPDGLGPLPGGGPGVGEVTIERLRDGDDGTIVTIDDLEIIASDGAVYRLSDVALAG